MRFPDAEFCDVHGEDDLRLAVDTLEVKSKRTKKKVELEVCVECQTRFLSLRSADDEPTPTHVHTHDNVQHASVPAVRTSDRAGQHKHDLRPRVTDRRITAPRVDDRDGQVLFKHAPYSWQDAKELLQRMRKHQPDLGHRAADLRREGETAAQVLAKLTACENANLVRRTGDRAGTRWHVVPVPRVESSHVVRQAS
jgi:hypothetical protein